MIILTQNFKLSSVIVLYVTHMVLELLSTHRLFKNYTFVKVFVDLFKLPFKCVFPNIVLDIVAFITGTLIVVLINHGTIDPVTAAFLAVVLHVMHLLELGLSL